ncbi:MAG: glycosyltransferase [Bacteroidia bacterium]|nr:glycosyltransferase [Bacteroidia bacterium]
MKILQINTSVNTGSTGRIAEEIGQLLIDEGHESYIAYGRGNRPSNSKLIKIGNNWDQKIHGIESRLFDNHGFASKESTYKLIKQIDRIKPDIIGLHNLHGYYLNIEVLFNYLSKTNIATVWTLFDCWAFTGHCTFLNNELCVRYKTFCYCCPSMHNYPSSYLIDNSVNNFKRKKMLFNSVSNMHLIVHSYWLQDIVKRSFLKDFPMTVIRSGVNLNIFKPNIKNDSIIKQYGLSNKKIILGVANLWNKRKGLDDFIKLNGLISENELIVLVGLERKRFKSIPSNIIVIPRTENVEELADLYSTADVFVNPTYADNFPTTNLEALSCGTPVITYNTGGSPEAINANTGIVVEQGDINGIYQGILQICHNGKNFYSDKCYERVVTLFDKEDRYREYLALYKTLLKLND